MFRDEPKGVEDPYTDSSAQRAGFEKEARAQEEAEARKRQQEEERALKEAEEAEPEGTVMANDYETAVRDGSYKPANTWDGLTWVGSTTWEETKKLKREPFRGYDSTLYARVSNIRSRMLTMANIRFAPTEKTEDPGEIVASFLRTLQELRVSKHLPVSENLKNQIDHAIQARNSKKDMEDEWRQIPITEPAIKFFVRYPNTLRQVAGTKLSIDR